MHYRLSEVHMEHYERIFQVQRRSYGDCEDFVYQKRRLSERHRKFWRFYILLYIRTVSHYGQQNDMSQFRKVCEIPYF